SKPEINCFVVLRRLADAPKTADVIKKIPMTMPSCNRRHFDKPSSLVFFNQSTACCTPNRKSSNAYSGRILMTIRKIPSEKNLALLPHLTSHKYPPKQASAKVKRLTFPY